MKDSWVHHPVAAALRMFASIGDLPDADDLDELQLKGAARETFLKASKRCAAAYATGAHGQAAFLAEELGASVVAALPKAQRDRNYLKRANDPGRGVTDPGKLADIVVARRRAA